jgi:hypothetical protein
MAEPNPSMVLTPELLVLLNVGYTFCEVKAHTEAKHKVDTQHKKK